ncbi:hypothetical protein QTP88_008065 [Uroleucon formosanum]
MVSVSVEFQNLLLSECFDQGLWSYESICESTEPAKDSGTQYRIIKYMKILDHTTQLVSAVGMFSDNETIEEIPTMADHTIPPVYADSEEATMDFSLMAWHLPTADNNDCLMTQNKKIKKTKSIRKKKKMKAKD